jgi:hypothetical protein
LTVDHPLAAADAMAPWSEWVPFEQWPSANRLPGVYMARLGPDGAVIYVGSAGPRAGSGTPKGIQGRLGVYASGKGMVSGLGEAASDRALADPDWLRERLAEVEAGKPMRAIEWGREAMARPGLYIRWTTTEDKKSALLLEGQVERLFPPGQLWNRGRVRTLFKFRE